MLTGIVLDGLEETDNYLETLDLYASAHPEFERKVRLICKCFYEMSLYFSLEGGVFAGLETDGLHATRPEFAKMLALFDVNDTAAVKGWYSDSAEFAAFRRRAASSRDGQHHTHPPDAYISRIQAVLTLSSVGTGTDVGKDWLDLLPAAESTTLVNCSNGQFEPVSARPLVAECLEEQGRLADAIKWCQAELSDPFQFK